MQIYEEFVCEIIIAPAQRDWYQSGMEIQDGLIDLRERLAAKKKSLSDDIDQVNRAIRNLPKDVVISFDERATAKNFQKLYYQAKVLECFGKMIRRGLKTADWEGLFLQSGAKLVGINAATFRGYLSDLKRRGILEYEDTKGRWKLTEKGLKAIRPT